MSTFKPFDADKFKAQKSAGRSGGARSWLDAKSLVIAGESEADFQTMLDSLHAEHQPATATEYVLVDQMMMAAWRLRRMHRIEIGSLKLNLKNTGRFVDDSVVRLQRSFARALRALEDMRAQQRKANAKAKKTTEPAGPSLEDQEAPPYIM